MLCGNKRSYILKQTGTKNEIFLKDFLNKFRILASNDS